MPTRASSWGSLLEEWPASATRRRKSSRGPSAHRGSRVPTLALDNLDQTIARIVKVTGDARDAIAKLNDVAKAVLIAANLVALGGAIVAGNPNGIITALQNAKDSLAD